MGSITPPRQNLLVESDFPDELWAKKLVSTVNQFITQTTNAFESAGTKYKTLTFNTGATVARSFPIDVPVDVFPSEIRVAQITGQVSTAANSVQWSKLAGGQRVRISLITGLSINHSYEIKLAMD